MARSVGRTTIGPLSFVCLLSFSFLPGTLRAQSTIPYDGFAPAGLAFDGATLYVLEVSRPHMIFRLDPVTGAVLGSFPGASGNGLDGGGENSDVVYGGDGSLFVTDLGVDYVGIVYEIDTAGTTIRNSFSIPFRGGAIAFDGTYLYVGDFDSSQVLVVDRSGTPIRSFFARARPAGMAFDPASGHLWVVSEFDDIVTEMTIEGELVRTCVGPRQPGPQGLGSVAVVGSDLYIGQCLDPDASVPPDIPGTIFVVAPSSLPCNPPFATTVDIDIDVDPGRFPNRVNPRSHAPITVALLATTTFAPSSVDLSSVRFGRTGVEAAAFASSMEDVDGDGDLDLLLRFRTDATAIACADTTASLTARTIDGGVLAGSDSVVTVGCRRP